MSKHFGGFTTRHYVDPAITRSIREAFDQDALARVCEMDEEEFEAYYSMTRTDVEDKPGRRVALGEDYYFHLDNGSNVLAVAHLDTVGLPHERTANFVDTEAGQVIFSRALDDRLGAYVILELLPKLGVRYDVLLTVGEESGCSTAAHFQTDKQYDWLIEFDRGGTDVVMYEYENTETREMVRNTGAQVGTGSFSDISYMEHLGIKGFNWGVGYTGDYHGPRAHAFLEDTFRMVAYYLDFHDTWAGTAMPHEQEKDAGLGWRYRHWDDDAEAEERYQKWADAVIKQGSSKGVRHWDADEVDMGDDDILDSGEDETDMADRGRALVASVLGGTDLDGEDTVSIEEATALLEDESYTSWRDRERFDMADTAEMANREA